MEEIEVPLEDAQETTMHSAEHARERWISGVALSSAILAVFAAITSLLSGHHANEAMIEQLQSSDKWAFYQAKGIKSAILSTKMELLHQTNKAASEKDVEKLKDYKTEQEEIAKEAKEKEEGAEQHLKHHLIFARGVTLFQIAIAICAIAALLRRRHFWWVSLVFGAVGTGFLIQGLLL